MVGIILPNEIFYICDLVTSLHVHWCNSERGVLKPYRVKISNSNKSIYINICIRYFRIKCPLPYTRRKLPKPGFIPVPHNPFAPQWNANVLYARILQARHTGHVLLLNSKLYQRVHEHFQANIIGKYCLHLGTIHVVVGHTRVQLRH